METVITCGTGGTCTLVITPYQATEDDYAAVSAIFGVVLAAACVIWGVKRLYVLLTSRPES